MTDTETVAAPKAATRRKPPGVKPPRDTITLTRSELKAMMAETVAPFQARVEELEKGGLRSIPTEEAPKPTMREANPEAVSDFTRKLLAHTHDMPEGGVVERERPYNVPLRWYLRRDGQYVQLQGDSKNRAMYTDLGFYPLSREEADEFVKHQKAGIERDQRTRANLFNQLRKLVKREPPLSAYVDDLDWDEELEGKSIEGLRQEWRRLCGKVGDPDRELPLERQRSARDPNAGKLAGVETGSSVEDLERKLSAPGARTRTIEVTHENASMFRSA